MARDCTLSVCTHESIDDPVSAVLLYERSRTRKSEYTCKVCKVYTKGLFERCHGELPVPTKIWVTWTPQEVLGISKCFGKFSSFSDGPHERNRAS